MLNENQIQAIATEFYEFADRAIDKMYDLGKELAEYAIEEDIDLSKMKDRDVLDALMPKFRELIIAHLESARNEYADLNQE